MGASGRIVPYVELIETLPLRLPKIYWNCERQTIFNADKSRLVLLLLRFVIKFLQF